MGSARQRIKSIKQTINDYTVLAILLLFVIVAAVLDAIALIWWHMKNDPTDCAVHRCEGCGFVDNPLCDYPSCEIMQSWYQQRRQPWKV